MIYNYVERITRILALVLLVLAGVTLLAGMIWSYGVAVGFGVVLVVFFFSTAMSSVQIIKNERKREQKNTSPPGGEKGEDN